MRTEPKPKAYYLELDDMAFGVYYATRRARAKYLGIRLALDEWYYPDNDGEAFLHCTCLRAPDKDQDIPSDSQEGCLLAWRFFEYCVEGKP